MVRGVDAHKPQNLSVKSVSRASDEKEQSWEPGTTTLCVCACVCVPVCVCPCMCTCVYECEHVCIYVYVHVNVCYVSVYECGCVCARVYKRDARVEGQKMFKTMWILCGT